MNVVLRFNAKHEMKMLAMNLWIFLFARLLSLVFYILSTTTKQQRSTDKV